MSKKIVILGAGLTGLSTAYHLQNGCAVYEQQEQVGGLACSQEKNGFIFDCDGHLLHFKTNYVKKLLHKLLPGVLTSHQRNSWIYSHNTYTRYPFQGNTFGLPASIIKRCIFGILQAKSKRLRKQTENFKDWLVEKFGKGITKYFMYPYNMKFWTVSPEELISDWTKDYVPLVGIKDVVNGALFGKTKPIGYNSEFWYPLKGGISHIPDVFARNIKHPKLSHKVLSIDTEKKVVNFANDKSTSFTHLVSTIPLIELSQMISPKLPQDVKEAFSQLRYVSIYNVNLGIDRENISDKHWIYYPEDKFCFFRVGFPTSFSANVAPKGTSSLYVEVSYSDNKPLDKLHIAERIQKDLKLAGILLESDTILTTQINDIKYGYVIYDYNYRKSVKTIRDFLVIKNIYPAGRYGAWRYTSMEDAILEGKELGELLKKD